MTSSQVKLFRDRLADNIEATRSSIVLTDIRYLFEIIKQTTVELQFNEYDSLSSYIVAGQIFADVIECDYTALVDLLNSIAKSSHNYYELVAKVKLVPVKNHSHMSFCVGHYYENKYGKI